MLKIEIVPVTSYRLRITDSCDNGLTYTRQTKNYICPKTLAKDWARIKSEDWEKRTFAPNGGAPYHNMTLADWDASRKRKETLYRRALPIFRTLLTKKP